MALEPTNKIAPDQIRKLTILGQIFLLVAAAIFVTYLANITIEWEAKEKVEAAIDHYVLQLGANASPLDEINEKAELASLKATVDKMREENAANSEDKVEATVTLLVTVLTLLMTIGLAYWNLQQIRDIIKNAGNDLAAQTSELLQSELARTIAVILMSFQFDRYEGWKRRPTDYKFDALIISYGEKAVKHAMEEEKLFLTADFKCDFKSRFKTSGSENSRNNLLFSLSLLDSTQLLDAARQADIQKLKEDNRFLAERLLSEMRQSGHKKPNLWLTEIRAEINFFELLYTSPSLQKAKYEALKKKIEKTKTALQSEDQDVNDLIGVNSITVCGNRLRALGKRLKFEEA